MAISDFNFCSKAARLLDVKKKRLQGIEMVTLLPCSLVDECDD